MIPVTEAHRLIAAELPEPAPETVDFADLAGRVLAQDITAPRPQPPFTNSAMDGFALRVVDAGGAGPDTPVTLNMMGVVAAGTEAPASIGPGQCMQVMTGAPVPKGADAVVMVEHTSGYDADPVRIFREPQAGDNIRRAGEEIKAGTTLLLPGLRIGPGELGVIAGCGLGQAEVYRRPKVAVFGTGDELSEPGDELLGGQIYNSNLPVLSHLTRLAGGEVAHSGVIRDDPAALKDFLIQALESCQVITASGGVSMGRFDFVRDVLLELGVAARFWKVAQKPGKPLFFGAREGRLVFGLPGNPVSSFIGFMEYVWPVLERLQGLTPTAKIQARLAVPYPAEGKRHRFLFGRVWLEGGQLLAAPAEKLGSHMLTAALGANAILEAPPAGNPLAPGQPVTVRMLPWAAIDEAKENL